MAYQGAKTALALLLVIMIWGGAMSQSNDTDCTNIIISMSPCLNYIQGNSTTAPTTGCCTQLQGVASSKPQCLCQVLNDGGSSLGLTINQTQAITLPRACNVQTPPASQCNTGTPNVSPSATPGSSSTVPSGKGSSSTSSVNGHSSDANAIKMAAPLLIFLVFVVSYVSTIS